MKAFFRKSYRFMVQMALAAISGLLVVCLSGAAHGRGLETGYAARSGDALRMFGQPPPWVADRNADPSSSYYQNLSPEEKEKLLRRYRQWKSLPPEKRQQLRNKMNQFREMPPDSRRLYEHRFQQWQQLSPNERQRIRKDLDNWDNLSPQEREIILRRFRD